MKMRPLSRKTPRFYVINPITDRRTETRFESRETAVVRFLTTDKSAPALAYDVGRYGLKIEMTHGAEPGDRLQIAFPSRPDHARCFGHVAWVRPMTETRKFEIGVAVDDWQGVVNGGNSWRGLKGVRPKQDRRTRPR